MQMRLNGVCLCILKKKIQSYKTYLHCCVARQLCGRIYGFQYLIREAWVQILLYSLFYYKGFEFLNSFILFIHTLIMLQNNFDCFSKSYYEQAIIMRLFLSVSSFIKELMLLLLVWFSARHSDRIRLAKEQIGNLTAICKCH